MCRHQYNKYRYFLKTHKNTKSAFKNKVHGRGLGFGVAQGTDHHTGLLRHWLSVYFSGTHF